MKDRYWAVVAFLIGFIVWGAVIWGMRGAVK